MKRHRDALAIWEGGACNPRGVARALVSAIDEAYGDSTADARNDPAVQMILDHLCFLCGLPQPSLDMMGGAWDEIMKQVKELDGLQHS